MILIDFIEDFVEDILTEFVQFCKSKGVGQDQDEFVSIESFFGAGVISTVSTQTKFSNQIEEMSCKRLKGDDLII